MRSRLPAMTSHTAVPRLLVLAISCLLVLLPCLVLAQAVKVPDDFYASTGLDPIVESDDVPLNTEVSILGAEDNTVTLSPPRRIQPRGNKIKQPSPATDQPLAAAASKGCNLLYMMSANPADALTRLKTLNPTKGYTSSQSKWTNAGALKQYGWTEKKNDPNWAYMGINDLLSDLSIDKSDAKTKNYQLLQDTAVNVDGKSYAKSGGVYNQVINPKTGLLIPYYIYSPANEAKTNNVRGDIVPLAQYSDVLFLQWSKLASREGNVKGLKHFLFLNIENVNTWAIIVKALMNKQGGKTSLPNWPGVTFSMNTKEGRALLSSQIGGPLAWFLIQHKDQLGMKSVEKVTIFRNRGMTNQDTDTPYPNLLFYVTDAPSVGHCQPDEACCCPKV